MSMKNPRGMVSTIRTCFTLVLLACAAAPTRADADAPPRDPLHAELASALADYERAQHLLSTQPDAARLLFRAVAQRMEPIAVRVPNGRLEYNIANAWLQSGDVGRAILHYRRAQRMIPRDDLLADNLREARSRCILSIRPGPGERILDALFFWHRRTSIRERANVGLAAFLLFWILLTVRLVLPRRGLTVAAVGSALVFAIAAASVTTQRWIERSAPPGVILAMDVPIYKGPAATYQRQIEQPLQPGVEFSRRERRGSWWRIQLADGKTGWMDAAAAELVVGDAAVNRQE